MWIACWLWRWWSIFWRRVILSNAIVPTVVKQHWENLLVLWMIYCANILRVSANDVLVLSFLCWPVARWLLKVCTQSLVVVCIGLNQPSIVRYETVIVCCPFPHQVSFWIASNGVIIVPMVLPYLWYVVIWWKYGSVILSKLLERYVQYPCVQVLDYWKPNLTEIIQHMSFPIKVYVKQLCVCWNHVLNYATDIVLYVLAKLVFYCLRECWLI